MSARLRSTFIAITGFALIGGLAFWVGARLATYQAEAAQAQQIARGRYLAEAAGLCAWCHTPERAPYEPDAEQGLIGGRRFDDCWGVTYSTNLTPDPAEGLGRWTDDQIVRAIRDGVRPDGALLAPPHPWQLYMGLADDDVRAIVAYLHSLSPASGRWPSPELIPSPPDFVAPPPVPPGPLNAPQTGVERGHYLAMSISLCVWCHTPRTAACVPDITQTRAGGLAISGPWGIAISPNISNDPIKGLGAWSDADIMRALTEGQTLDGRQLEPAMPWRIYAHLTQDDVAALIGYLRMAQPVSDQALTGGAP